MPTEREIALLRRIPVFRKWCPQFERRSFSHLEKAPLIQGRFGEWRRMIKRLLCSKSAQSGELARESNRWLMETMARETSRPSVTAVHSYEDCSLWPFEAAKRRGKACIYDMPTVYYEAWKEAERGLTVRFADWLPVQQNSFNLTPSFTQKKEEMRLADLVLVPTDFVRRTIEASVEKRIRLAAYGVDCEFWRPAAARNQDRPFRYIYAGHSSIRKGTPLLLEAWRKANLKDCELYLVGSWHLAESKKRELPKNVRFVGQVSREILRSHMQAADVFVFPSFFEGFGLVVLEALACGLPFTSSDTTVAADIADDSVGRVFPTGDLDMLVEQLRFFGSHREILPEMRTSARAKAESLTWKSYREAVSRACNEVV